MNNKKYNKIEKHYNKLVKKGVIKNLNDAYIYKLAIDKAFSLSDVGKSKIKGDTYSELIKTLEHYRKEKVIVDSFEERRGFVDAPCDFGYSEIIPNGEITITINLVKE